MQLFCASFAVTSYRGVFFPLLILHWRQSLECKRCRIWNHWRKQTLKGVGSCDSSKRCDRSNSNQRQVPLADATPVPWTKCLNFKHIYTNAATASMPTLEMSPKCDVVRSYKCIRFASKTSITDTLNVNVNERQMYDSSLFWNFFLQRYKFVLKMIGDAKKVNNSEHNGIKIISGPLIYFIVKAKERRSSPNFDRVQ